MKPTKIPALILLAFFTAIMTYAFLPDYTRTALKRFEFRIDDYRTSENRVVEAGQPQPWAISPLYNKKQISGRHKKLLTDLKTVSFLVIRNNEILHEQYWNAYTEKSISNSFSTAKSMLSLLVGIAIQEGKIKGLDQPVSDFIPEYRSGGRERITIRHLLTMSSGLDWNESYWNPFAESAAAYFGTGLKRLVRGLPAAGAPGGLFRYSSGDSQILGDVIAVASGTSLSNYASEKLWKPLGAAAPALWSLDGKDGMERAFCCLNSTARDFARLGQLVLDGGVWKGKQLVPKKYIDEATTPQTDMVDDAKKPIDYYGYQFWILRHRGLTIPYMRGVKGQYIFIIPQKKAVVVRLGEKRIDRKKDNTPLDAFEWIDAALDLMD